MNPSLSHRSSSRLVASRGFAAGGLIAAIAAATLAACGPRDEAPIAGGSTVVAPSTIAAVSDAHPAAALPSQAEAARLGTPVPLAQTPPAALAPAPAYAPPPVTVSAAPASPMQSPNGYAPASAQARVLPAADSDQDGTPQVRPVPAAQPAPRVAPSPVAHERIGSVTAIEPVRDRPQGSGAGAVIGGVLGGVLGNQFGHGLGRAAMTGVGAAGGAIAGNNVERNYKTAVVGYRVHVRLDNGTTRTFQRKSIGNLHVGERVRLDANGFRPA